jgi:hypothetical protein
MKFFLTLLFMLLRLCIKAQDTTFYAPYRSGYSMFSVHDELGLIDENKRIVLPNMYDEISDIQEGLIKVRLEEKVGFVNTQNTVKIPLTYNVDTNNMIGARIYQSIQLDNNGQEAGDNFYIAVDNNYTNFSEKLCAVILNGKYGFIDTAGKHVIPFIYDGADNFYKKIAIIRLGNRYGAINHSGQIIIPCKYVKLVVIEDRGLYAEINGKIIILDFNGKVISKNLAD